MPHDLRRVTIPRADGGVRTLTLLGPELAARYERAVLGALPWIERSLLPGVHANRAHVARSGLELEPWTRARRRHRRAVLALMTGPGRAAYVGDVRDCYASITPATVAAALARADVPARHRRRVLSVLRDLEDAGVLGLPIGPGPSAVLANAALAPVDAALAAAAATEPIRWVDDVAVPVPDRRAARRVERAFEDALRALGLEPAAPKCRVVDLDELQALVRSASTAARPPHGMMRAP